MKLNPPQSHRRSRRQRKKLRIDEFKELGFTIAIQLTGKWSLEAESELMLALITEYAEPRYLKFGGVIRDGYIVSAGRESATNADRTALQTWSQSQPEVSSVEIGKLEDAWHDQRRSQ